METEKTIYISGNFKLEQSLGNGKAKEYHFRAPVLVNEDENGTLEYAASFPLELRTAKQLKGNNFYKAQAEFEWNPNKKKGFLNFRCDELGVKDISLKLGGPYFEPLGMSGGISIGESRRKVKKAPCGSLQISEEPLLLCS